MNSSVTRRTFLKGSAATAALAATGAGVCSLGAWQAEVAHAEGSYERKEGASLCNGCSSKCGLVATTLGGQLFTLRGSDVHPYAKGTICGRGHGVAQIAYSDERLTQPMRRAADGSFEAIDWDTAFSEIGAKVKDILAKNGPEALAIVQDPRPSGKEYSKRFINALGSANIYTHGAACNSSKEAGFAQTIGTGNFSVDFGNSKMVVFIGRSYGDGIRPSSVQSLAAAADKGTRIVIVDPRLNNSGIFATDWVSIKPGTDLAFLLGICNVLIEEDLYDHEFVEQNAVGFDEFAAQAKEYTPAWAEQQCGVPAATIEEIARALAKAAPAAAVEASWRAAFGCAHQNSFDTARAVTAVNALLGSWGAKGGALLTSSPKAGDIDKQKFPSAPKPEAKRVGDKEYPLAPSGMGSNLAVLQAALDGAMKGVFFYNSNAVQGYAQPKVWREGLEKTDLVVTIDVQMSETALASDYVLPECTYLERMELPEFIGGKKHYVAMRTQVLEPIHPETKPCDEIFAGLAEACGVGEYFPFTVEELVAAQLETVGVSLDELKEKGIVELSDPGFEYKTPKFKTPTEKFQFSSEAVGEAGLNPVIGWTPRLVEPKQGEFYLVGGKQGIHSHTMTQNVATMNAISREYGLERAWISAQDAADLGIADGDMIEIASSEHTGQVAARVTQRMRPGVVFLPTHYGGSSPYQSRAYQFGLNMTDFVPFHMEPGTGATMSQEVAVTVRKVEAYHDPLRNAHQHQEMRGLLRLPHGVPDDQQAGTRRGVHQLQGDRAGNVSQRVRRDRARAVHALRERPLPAGVPDARHLHHRIRRGAGRRGEVHRLQVLHGGVPLRRAHPDREDRRHREVPLLLVRGRAGQPAGVRGHLHLGRARVRRPRRSRQRHLARDRPHERPAYRGRPDRIQDLLREVMNHGLGTYDRMVPVSGRRVGRCLPDLGFR